MQTTRQIFLDTETTGFEFKKGHRIIEFGAVEMIERTPTGNNLHFYFKPDIAVDEGAFKVHGLSNEFLNDMPEFGEKADEILTYLQGAELLIHNARFDIPFLNWELNKLSNNKWGKIEDHCTITDTLLIARKKHPSQRNSLDALCTRYAVNNKHRKLHGALLDAELLLDVYLMMTGGQLDLFTLSEVSATNTSITTSKQSTKNINISNKEGLIDLLANSTPHEAHEQYLTLLDKKSNGKTLWRKL